MREDVVEHALREVRHLRGRDVERELDEGDEESMPNVVLCGEELPAHHCLGLRELVTIGMRDHRPDVLPVARIEALLRPWRRLDIALAIEERDELGAVMLTED